MKMRNVDVHDITATTQKRSNPRSPTAVTNSAPRRNSTRSPDARAVKFRSMEDENFQQSQPAAESNPSPQNIGLNRSAFASCSAVAGKNTRANNSNGDANNGDRDSPDDTPTKISCSTPTRRDVQEMIRRVKEVQAKAVAVSSKTKSGEPHNMDKKRTTPKVIKVALKPGRETDAAKKKEKNVPLPPTFEACLRNFADTGTLLCREECAMGVVGEQRGDDKDFFTSFGENNENSPDRTRTTTSVSSISTKSQKTPGQGFRSSRGAMRLPEAINIMEGPKLDGKKRSRSAPTRRRRERSLRRKNGQISDRTPVSPTAEIVNGGEDPESMRKIRLQLFKRDDESMTVPKASLSRALGELVKQDGQIDTMQTELDKTRAQLKEAQQEISRQRTSTPTMNNTPDLEGKLKKRKDVNSKLRSKITDLEIQVNHLRAELSRTKTESEKRVARYRNRQDDLQAQLEITNAKLKVKSSPNLDRPPESPTVLELRADIASLRSQLAEARHTARKSQDAQQEMSQESQLVALRAKLIRTERELAEHRSKIAGMPELLRLKTRLQRVEKELELERLGTVSPTARPASDGKAAPAATSGGLSEILRLRTKLHQTEKELSQLKKNSDAKGVAKSIREDKLSRDLAEAQRLLSENEASSRVKIEGLMVRIDTADREIAEGRKLAEREVANSREESKRLRVEVEALKEQLAHPRDEQKPFRQKEIERELEESKETENKLRSIIDSLMKRVDAAESEAKDERSRNQANTTIKKETEKIGSSLGGKEGAKDSKMKTLELQNIALQNEVLELRDLLANNENKHKSEIL